MMAKENDFLNCIDPAEAKSKKTSLPSHGTELSFEEFEDAHRATAVEITSESRSTKGLIVEHQAGWVH
jgi:hypothetical protein